VARQLKNLCIGSSASHAPASAEGKRGKIMKHHRNIRWRRHDTPRMTRRQLVSGMAAAAIAMALPHPPIARAQVTPWVAMAQAAGAFLAALEMEKRRRAIFSFDSPERFNWHYVPRRREGLPLKAMTDAERTAAHQLLQSALSEAGYRKAVDIMRLEEVLRQTEFFPFSRDPENYAFTVFSAGGAPFPLGWRLEGHHLSLNFTIATDSHGAVTPAFMGAHPAEVRTGSLKGLRVLGREQDLAFALVQSLDADQRQKTRIAARSFGDIVSGPRRADSLKSPLGLALAEMSPVQRDQALRLIEEYVRNMRREIADAQLRSVHAAGIELLHFAWAGSLEAGQAHYYRLHGPTLLIEYDNTQNGANHIHSVWHDLRDDFGIDLLRTHYETGHHR
jgi:Protein of unknown function (DUF3500)